ncbi:MAG: MucB/RseB C-terminal domain-containing protein [Agarilytica sp.]
MPSVFFVIARRLCLASCLALSFGVAAQSIPSSSSSDSPPEVKALLAKVAGAIRSSNYQGRLTYEHSGKLDVVEIAHGVRDGVEFERVLYLNGPERQLDPGRKAVDCRSVGGHLMAGGVFERLGLPASALNQYYEYHILGSERVAGHMSWVLQLVPKDADRHGVILAVDKQSFLPTKSLFVTSGRKVLERLHFVSLDTNAEFDDAFFSTGVKNVGPGHETKTSCEPSSKPVYSEATLRPSWVPGGFVLSGYQYSDDDGHMETYTDGLVAFSVFIKPVLPASQLSSTGARAGIKKGATVVAVNTIVDASTSMQVSVLGEIPQHTANRILASVGATHSN